ncbi:MAG: undecaprenyl-diphosphatase UppP [bacterium]
MSIVYKPMDIIEVIILGIIQGLTEFLPISSSGHLVIARDLFHLTDQGIFFDVMLHLGTFFAVVIYFWTDIIKILSGIFKKGSGEQKLAWWIVLGTIPVVIIGFLAEDLVSEFFRDALWVGSFLIILGFVFILIEKKFNSILQKKELSGLRWLDVLIIGVAQSIALLPGVSRSGATIVAGMARGLTRTNAARFAFLLSLPAILGAVVLEGSKLLAENTILNWNEAILGMLFAFASGYLAVYFLMKILKKYTLFGFALYVIGAGLLVLIARFYF